MRVAIVYDHLNKIGGAETILVALSNLFPKAHWYTSFWDVTTAPFSRNWHVHASWFNRFAFLRRHHEWVPFLMPFIFEAFDFHGYDLVISVSSAEGKGIITPPGVIHLNYCLTPTRYLYSHASEYLSNPLLRFVGHYLRLWDQVAATRPDEMIAISTRVKNRIKKYYNRIVPVIYPPVDLDRFQPPSSFVPPYSDYFLTVSRLVPYKRLELLITAFNTLGTTLVIVGTGQEMHRLKRLAKPNIYFVGQVADRILFSYYKHCRAFIQVNDEDFGLAMCEAQAAGKPVIAYRESGAGEIVRPDTGILFAPQTVGGIMQALDQFQSRTWSKKKCRTNANRFNQLQWKRQISERIKHLCRKKP